MQVNDFAATSHPVHLKDHPLQVNDFSSSYHLHSPVQGTPAQTTSCRMQTTYGNEIIVFTAKTGMLQ